MDSAIGIKYGVPTPEQIAGKVGKEILQAIMDGELPHPPISETLSFWITEVGDGSVVFAGEPVPHLLNPMGGVHGGWALTMIDSATGCAGLSLLPAGSGSLRSKPKRTCRDRSRRIRVAFAPRHGSWSEAGKLSRRRPK